MLDKFYEADSRAAKKNFKGVKILKVENDVLTIEMGDGRKFVSPLKELKGTFIVQKFADVHREYSNDINQNINKETAPYELIDIKKNNETKIFLGFDKFFKSQYKEMFDYSYTIIIAFFVFIGMLIYYAFLLPNEAVGMSRNMGTRDNVNEGNINNENDSDNNYELKE